jgi:hypothetical protein
MALGPFVYPGPQNVFIPQAQDANGQALFVDFSRSQDWMVNRYAQIVPVQNTIGIWYRMGLDERARLIDTASNASAVWADDQERPKPQNTSENFAQDKFQCIRYTYPAQIGQMTSEQAVWNEVQRQERIQAQKAMTWRTQAVINVLTTSSLYPSNHVSDFAGSSGIPNVTGNWAGSTSTRQTIRRSIDWAQLQVTLDTRAGVDDVGGKTYLVMSPNTAQNIAFSQEIVELVRNSENAIKILQLGDKQTFAQKRYGLPAEIYGCEVIIEKTVRVTSHRGAATSTASFAVPDGTVIMVYKPNEFEGQEGGKTFSTVAIHIYRKDDLAVETDADSWNRLTKIAVTDTFDVNMTAGLTGYLFQNVF